ncbi:MAG: T9SS type A sorting domain-containing protein [Bacteroidota bacterium]
MVGFLNAQTITPDMFDPVPGTSISYVGIQNIDPLGGGEQTWDFSNLDVLGTTEYSVVLPEDNPNGADFTNADFIIADDDDNGNAHQFTNNSMFITGWYDEDSVEVMIDPWEILRFPMNFGDTWTDIYLDAQAEQELPGGIVGNSILSFDAFGTVILHDGTTINNASRVKAVTDDIYYTELGPFKETVTSYWWYAPGFSQPIAWYAFVEGEGFSFGAGQVIQGSNNVGEVSNSRIKAYPNPTSEQITLETEQPQSVELSTLSGVRVRGWTIENTTTLNLSGIAEGIYLLRVTDGSSSEVMKVMIR